MLELMPQMPIILTNFNCVYPLMTQQLLKMIVCFADVYFSANIEHLSFIDSSLGGFGEILPEVIIFGNIITEGNISPNPPSGGSINDILYRKLS